MKASLDQASEADLILSRCTVLEPLEYAPVYVPYSDSIKFSRV